MILTASTRAYFQELQAKVSKAMAHVGSPTPYFVEGDPIIVNYELIREAWLEGAAIKSVCQKHNLSRTQYYDKEDRFVQFGLPGLFPDIKPLAKEKYLERLVIMVDKARSCLAQQAILRIAEAVPATRAVADMEMVSQILASYGRSVSNRPADIDFWSRIQRTLSQLDRLRLQEPSLSR